MKKENIVFLGSGVYHPKKKVTNEEFLTQYQEKGIAGAEKAYELMNALGRKERYLVGDSGETVVTMAAKSARKAMEKANVSPEELDMIVFITDTPEQTYPTNALLLNRELNAVNAHVSFDSNSNCTGMLTGIDQASHYMKANKRVKTALIVGSLYASSIIHEDDAFLYPLFADGSAAVILRKEIGEETTGFIDSINYTNPIEYNVFSYPRVGFANLNNPAIPTNEWDSKLRFSPVEVDFASKWKRMSEQVLGENNMEIKDVDHWLFSQFAKPQIDLTMEALELPSEMTTFIGDKYGYMGPSSPIFALQEALEKGTIKKGSTVIFASVGAGYNMSVVLFKF